MNKIARIPLERRQRGRPHGSRNKIPALLKDAILMAAENADEEGLVGYLEKQALDQSRLPSWAFSGKVLPLQMTGGTGGPLEIRWLPPQEPPSREWYGGSKPEEVN